MKKIISIIIMGLLICCSFGVQGVFYEKQSSETTNTSLNDVILNLKISTLLKLFHYPSFSACIIEDNEITWSNSYGYYDLENNKPATINTIYNIASITKTITGTALMQLWEQGLFDLDEDVNKYLPFSLRNPHFPDDSITFRMLLSHSSSLYPETWDYYRFDFSADPPFENYPYPWLEEHLLPGGDTYYPQRWSNTYRPGENCMYANVNFVIIAYLVELISGENLVEYCKEHIFIPLEMYNTSFNLSELDIDNVAVPYHYHDGEYLHINELSYIFGADTPPEKYWRDLHYPTGGVYSTISDLSHFLMAHMSNGFWNGVQILEEDTIEEMHKVQPPGNPDQGTMYHGLAWINFINPLIFNIHISGHGGDSFGSSTMMMYAPSENIGIIHFTNGDRQFEENPVLMGFLSMILLLQLLFKQGGYNFFTHIGLGDNGG